MTVFGLRIPREALIRTGYLVVGIKFGTLWLAQGTSSPWEHALRLVALMAIVMTVATAVRWWAARLGRPVAHHPIGRFLMAKMALVAMAVAAGLALENSVSNVDLWVGLGIAAVVAVVGPLIHPWLINGAPAEPDTTNAAVAAV
ncbi:hypothetical protein ORI20_03735 [Mycobacterium sp. CVI_P3]|uniref:Uncharacterized protein n=1 Tax=Mycobacterium pinniadriaticum TaxID=2994102 RepID=A0ABT3S8G8_9MYCO|nr:hypothetical protein [Mycobacterium pinniadriaticum]MCX2929371.1 hypothetical protein [Mycobacterium pinniadriaticum]MCX2935795.1 hypothetical protein [Mycobacterium pinniadriaticum]